MDGYIILAGDFNKVMDPILDKRWSKGEREAVHMVEKKKIWD